MGIEKAPIESTAIQDVAVFELKQIGDQRGSVLHMLRDDSEAFTRFGEIYFSEVFPGVVKAWKRHKQMTQRLAVPCGMAKFVLYDDRQNSASIGHTMEIVLGRPDHYRLLCIPPMIWYGFQSLSKSVAIIANCPDMHHDPSEADLRDYREAGFPYSWEMEKAE